LLFILYRPESRASPATQSVPEYRRSRPGFKKCITDIYYIFCILCLFPAYVFQPGEYDCFMKENEIIAQLQQQIGLCDDMKAYRRLYDLLYERLFWFSYSFVKSREAAEEIVSDVFIKLWTIRNKLPDIDNLVVFLYTIAKNFSLNYITKNYKHPQVSLDEIQLEIASSVNPEELYISSEMAARINQAVRELPSKCRLIFQMVREDGLKHKEVASILHISDITVRNQLTIAAKKIAQAIQPQLPVPAPKKNSLH